MFYCQLTGELSKSGVSPHHITVHTRERIYTKWVRNEETNKWEEVFVAKGWEIVKEIIVGDEGLRLWNGWSEEERQQYVRYAFPHFFKNEGVETVVA